MSALGSSRKPDECGVRVSLNGDSLALKASAKHRSREGSDQGVHPYVPVLGTPVCTGFPTEIGRWRDRRRRRALYRILFKFHLLPAKHTESRRQPIVNAAEFHTETLDNNQSARLAAAKEIKTSREPGFTGLIYVCLLLLAAGRRGRRTFARDIS